MSHNGLHQEIKRLYCELQQNSYVPHSRVHYIYMLAYGVRDTSAIYLLDFLYVIRKGHQNAEIQGPNQTLVFSVVQSRDVYFKQRQLPNCRNCY